MAYHFCWVIFSLTSATLSEFNDYVVEDNELQVRIKWALTTSVLEVCEICGSSHKHAPICFIHYVSGADRRGDDVSFPADLFLLFALFYSCRRGCALFLLCLYGALLCVHQQKLIPFSPPPQYTHPLLQSHKHAADWPSFIGSQPAAVSFTVCVCLCVASRPPVHCLLR